MQLIGDISIFGIEIAANKHMTARLWADVKAKVDAFVSFEEDLEENTFMRNFNKMVNFTNFSPLDSDILLLHTPQFVV